MDKFLGVYSLTSLNSEEIKNLNRSTTNKDIESVIINSPQRSTLVHWAYLVNSIKNVNN